nr:MAG TPA: hypothetical protein [Microviridae sp.]
MGWPCPLLSLGVCGGVAPPLSRSAGAVLSSGDARGMRSAQPPPSRRLLAGGRSCLALRRRCARHAPLLSGLHVGLGFCS